MKKYFLYLLLLLPACILSSCSKDDLAPFDMTLTLSGVTQANGDFYAVYGDNVTIEALTINPVGGKNTQVSNVMFYIDGTPLIPSPWNPTGPWTFSTTGIPVGRHQLGITGNLLQVDQSIQNFVADYNIVIVGDNESLPEGAPELGSYSQTISFQ